MRQISQSTEGVAQFLLRNDYHVFSKIIAAI